MDSSVYWQYVINVCKILFRIYDIVNSSIVVASHELRLFTQILSNISSAESFLHFYEALYCSEIAYVLPWRRVKMSLTKENEVLFGLKQEFEFPENEFC